MPAALRQPAASYRATVPPAVGHERATPSCLLRFGLGMMEVGGGCGGVWLSETLPWEDAAAQDGAGGGGANPPQLSARQWRLAERQCSIVSRRGQVGGPARLQALLAQLQPAPQRPLAWFNYEPQPAAGGVAARAAAGGMALAVSGDTVFEPVEYHFKIPHGLFLREATSVAVDSRDFVFVYNRGNMPILVFDTEGNLVDMWGNPTPNKGTLESPPDPYGNVLSTYIGSHFVRPHAISVDHEDNLWLTDDVANTITKCDRGGRRLMMICSGGVVLTAESEMATHIAQVATPCSKLSGGVGFNRPTDCCVDPSSGDIFITDGYGNARVHHFRADGTHVKSFGSPARTPLHARPRACREQPSVTAGQLLAEAALSWPRARAAAGYRPG